VPDQALSKSDCRSHMNRRHFTKRLAYSGLAVATACIGATHARTIKAESSAPAEANDLPSPGSDRAETRFHGWWLPAAIAGTGAVALISRLKGKPFPIERS
jgi:hypothetical protein